MHSIQVIDLNILFSIRFADKSEYKNFWNTIDIPLAYSNTNKDGERIYEHKNLFFKIKKLKNWRFTFMFMALSKM